MRDGPVSSCPRTAESADNIDPKLLWQMASEGRAIRFTARGRSMRPFILDGDRVTVMPARPDELRRLSIALFTRDEGQPVLHRLVRTEIRNGHILLVTRGDRLLAPAETTPAANLLGRVVAIERRGRVMNPDSPLFRACAQAWACFRGCVSAAHSLARFLRGRRLS